MSNYRLATIESNQENRELISAKGKCDKYDYLAAVACGSIGGMIDIFLVGAPGDSTILRWTDTQVDKAVVNFAKLMGCQPARGETEINIKRAIGFLENGNNTAKFGGFKVNYDQSHSGDVQGAFKMATKNHHMMSLGHSPDIVGLFFSILNQFTSTSTFIAGGQLITIQTENFELHGNNFIAKIFCGVANWFGHLMSDIAGSSGSVVRGTGIVMPFYELFGFCKFGRFDVGKDKQDLATIATRAFQEGYDLRFGLAMSIPVLITELSIRLVWALRRHFDYGYALKECIPSQKHDDLRIMLLIGNGTLCVMDGIDAGVRSGGNFLLFFLRLNLVAWCRLVMLVLKEVCIRVGFKGAIQKQIEAYQRINEALQVYLMELEKIDIELFREETEKYNKTVMLITSATSEKELNVILLSEFERLGIAKPWKGDFNEHMSNKNATLVFE